MLRRRVADLELAACVELASHAVQVQVRDGVVRRNVEAEREGFLGAWHSLRNECNKWVG